MGQPVVIPGSVGCWTPRVAMKYDSMIRPVVL